MSELEVGLCVVVADVGYHLSDEGHLAFGQQSGLHIAANHAAEAAAEVLMAGVGEERAAVGQHAHKAAEQPLQREGIHLALHSIKLVVEPPAASKLDFAWLGALLEVACHGGKHLVVRGIDAV